MAIFSPALVVAMCVMFVLTRLQSHYYIFEKVFLFGLKYCLEPQKTDFENIARAMAASKGSQSTQGGKKKGKARVAADTSTAPKTKITASALTVRRTMLHAPFFSHSAEFPHHKEFGHLLTLCCGYLAAYVFEETVGFFFPDVLANRRSAYVALFGVGFALWESFRISLDMTSWQTMCMLGGLGWLIALFVVSAGDFQNFVRFESAFAGLRKFFTFILTERLKYTPEKAASYAVVGTLFVRAIVITVASVISAASAATARHFSKLDYLMNCEYREDEKERQDDPYYLGKPTSRTILGIALDYVLAALVVILWVVTPRGDGAYPGLRLVLILVAAVFRLCMTRLRIQMYLDTSLDAYRSFWVDKAAMGVMTAGHRATVQVITKSFHTLSITVSYVAPAVIPLLLAVVAKLDGGISFKFWSRASIVEAQPVQVFARELAAFLAWWSLASYVIYAGLSFSYEALVDIVEPGGRERSKPKMPPPSTNSERRKFKRMMRENTA